MGFHKAWTLMTKYVKCFVNSKALSPGKMLSLFRRAKWDYSELQTQTVLPSLACLLQPCWELLSAFEMSLKGKLSQLGQQQFVRCVKVALV